jgi:hypothetical protein
MIPACEVYKVVRLTIMKSGAMKALVDLQLPSGLILVDCGYIVTGDDWFVNPPQRWTMSGNQRTDYVNLVRFATDDAERNFQRLALDAIRRYSEGERW